ncbi:MAG: integration host factor [Actinomycetia bacterium]|nr:integration host factor [Actinomycetes bacterium]
MALPKLSDAERRAALKKAAAARQARAELKKKLKSGSVKLKEMLSTTDDPIVGRMKVGNMLESLPGVGKARATKKMKELEISPTRRVQGLGANQRANLLKEFK